MQKVVGSSPIIRFVGRRLRLTVPIFCQAGRRATREPSGQAPFQTASWLFFRNGCPRALPRRGERAASAVSGPRGDGLGAGTNFDYGQDEEAVQAALRPESV